MSFTIIFLPSDFYMTTNSTFSHNSYHAHSPLGDQLIFTNGQAKALASSLTLTLSSPGVQNSQELLHPNTELLASLDLVTSHLTLPFLLYYHPTALCWWNESAGVKFTTIGRYYSSLRKVHKISSCNVDTFSNILAVCVYKD